jgi:hypothetical protein
MAEVSLASEDDARHVIGAAAVAAPRWAALSVAKRTQMAVCDFGTAGKASVVVDRVLETNEQVGHLELGRHLFFRSSALAWRCCPNGR